MKSYKFNFDVKYTEYFSDEYNMVLGQNQSWDSDGDNGKGDSIGRTMDAYFIYRDHRFIEAIKKCWFKVEYKYSKNKFVKFFQKIWRRNKDYYYKGFRHPSKIQRVGLSRDHTTNTIFAFYMSGMPEEELKEFVTHLRWKISDFSKFVPDMWLWVRALSGIKWAYILYSIILPFITLIYLIQNKLIYKIAGFKPEMHQDDFYVILNHEKPKFKDKWAKRLFPIYALRQQGIILYLMKDNFLLNLSKKILLKITPKHNYTIKMLFGDFKSFKKEDVYNFKQMTSGRWSGILDPYINDRAMRIIEDKKKVEYNCIDVDFVRKLYEIGK